MGAVCFGATAIGLVASTVSAPAAGAAGDGGLGFDATKDLGSLYNVERIIGVQSLWAKGFTGKGVDVAVIDTGVSPVAGLDGGQVVNGPDFSFDATNPDLTHLDSYGHGTHMAGIIAGRDEGTGSYADPSRFVGVAPDSRVVNVKVGATDGAVDVSQVIAGIEWVTANAHRDGLNIGVLNLSFGTDAVQPALLDPLAYAVDQAWRSGIVVVVAAGNDGLAAPQVSNPATNPAIIAVGADDPMGTLSITDDKVPAFASHGNILRSVDVIAPGTHLLSLRVPGSIVDLANPGAVVGERFIRGSGTSQAAAVVSGLAAVLRQKYPTASPDQIKRYLTSTARRIGVTSWLALPLLGNPINAYYAGNGIVDAAPAATMSQLAPAFQLLALPSTGLGSLDLARGTARVVSSDLPLVGELDIFGQPWVPGWLSHFVKSSQTISNDWTGNRWTDGAWTGNRWTGNRWTSNRWTGNRWTGNRWTGNRWSSGSWS
jgi:serine protease AprX